MSEQIEKLRATLAELHEELQGLDAGDAEARELLAAALDDIGAALPDDSTTGIESESFLQRLRDSARHFEESHPQLSHMLGGFIDSLSQLGI